MSLVTLKQRILPVRGIVCTHDRKGRALSLVDVHRWIRVNRVIFKVHKLDLLCNDALPADYHDMVAYTRGLDIRPSLRTNCEASPPDEETLRSLDLLDVFLCPLKIDSDGFRQWLSASKNAELPVRIQLQTPIDASADIERVAQEFAEAGTVAVNIVLHDSFSRIRPCRDEQCASSIKQAELLTHALDLKDIEVNLYGLPKARISEDLWRHAGGGREFFLDHQQYNQRSHELGSYLFGTRPYFAGKILMVLLARFTSARNPVDDLFLEWLFLHAKWILFWVMFVRKLTRDLRLPFGKPKPLADPEASYAAGLHKRVESVGPSHDADVFARAMPALATANHTWGDFVEWRDQRKYFDAVDETRRGFTDRQEALTKRAIEITTNRPPDGRIEATKYGAYKTFHEPLSGAIRWMAMTNKEKISSSVGIMEAPFTVSVTFGGGFAEYIGFAVGRHCKIVCPMIEYTHRLVLHVAEDGSYVLLRDDELMRPVEFEGQFYAPLTLLYPFDLLLSVWNIDDNICSQSVDIWHGETAGLPDPAEVKYSIVIFSTRFSRRLQCVLQSIVHQADIDPKSIEVIVGYVPGIDGTDDVIDSIRLSHPEFRIARIPYPVQNTKSKGFVINECCAAASGEWIVLLDSDVLLPPNMFARLSASLDGATFIAPEGRCMLDKATTAKILLGELVPWDDWDALKAEATDDRSGEAEGIPIGYCQIFKKSCLEKVQYAEYEHFERADSDFGLEMRKEFGKEKRLEGISLLHLEHGGSQWFGTFKNL